MRVVYRMRGLLGDATEDMVDSLDTNNDDEIDNEEVFKMAAVLSTGSPSGKTPTIHRDKNSHTTGFLILDDDTPQQGTPQHCTSSTARTKYSKGLKLARNTPHENNFVTIRAHFQFIN